MLKQPFASGAGQYPSDERRTDFRGVTLVHPDQILLIVSHCCLF